MSVSARSSADAEDLINLRIFEAGEHYTFADISGCSCDDDFHGLILLVLEPALIQALIYGIFIFVFNLSICFSLQ